MKRKLNLSARLQMIAVSSLLFTFLFAYQPLNSQTVGCNDFVQISVGTTCLLNVFPDMLLEGGPYPTSGFQIELSDNGTVLESGLDSIVTDGNQYLDMTLDYAITYVPTGISCWGEIRIEDKLSPICIAPADVVISCADMDLIDVGDPAALEAEFGAFTAFDNCTVDAITTTFLTSGDPCDPASFIRAAVATDASGNGSASCEQRILVTEDGTPAIASLEIPGDFTTTCGGANLADSLKIESLTCPQDPFIWNHNFDDAVVPIPGTSCQLIIRTHTVFNWCSTLVQDLGRMDLDNDGEDGDAFNLVTDGVYFYLDSVAPANQLNSMAYGGFTYKQVIHIGTQYGGHTVNTVGISADMCTDDANIAGCDTTATFSIDVQNYCGPQNQLQVQTEIDFHMDGTIDFSSTDANMTATFPKGTHNVKVLVVDSCQNVSLHNFPVEVHDCSPPIAICHAELTIIEDPTQVDSVEILATELDQNSLDACGGPLTYETRIAGSTDPWAPSISIPFMTDTILVELRVTDESGNANSCVVNVILEEYVSQTLACNDFTQFSVGLFCSTTIVPDNILEGSHGPNSLYQVTVSQDTNILWSNPEFILMQNLQGLLGDTLLVTISEISSGNACWGHILIEDKLPPVPVCLVDHVFQPDPTTNPNYTMDATEIDAGSNDNCTIQSFEIALVDDQLNRLTTPAPSIDLINYGDTVLCELIVTDSYGNSNSCITSLIIEPQVPTVPYFVEGRVFDDLNGDCDLQTGENGVGGWPLVITSMPSNNITIGNAAADGSYELQLDALQTDTLLKVFILTPLNLTGNCPNLICIGLDTITNDSFVQHFGLEIPPALCTNVNVDIATPYLRRCFDNTYTIQYSNYGGIAADGTELEVTFDDFLNIKSSSFPWTTVDGQTYTFDVGSIDPGTMNRFQVVAEVDCNALLGQSHLSKVISNQQGDCSVNDPNYTGPSVEVDGYCQNDSVYFIIRNVGDEDMVMPRNYIVIEDIILHKSSIFDLPAGDSLVLTTHGKGNTCRLEAEQVAGHPGNSMPSVVVEGCGTNDDGGISLGYVIQFPQDDHDSWRDYDYQPNIGSFDPNDIIAFPRGVDSRHFIKKNIPIEYMIRFQNTGTDTAFTVRIENAIPAELQSATILPGASSHDYRFEKMEDGTINFVFDNILLPDSTTNEAASNGFVKYKIWQQTDLPVGTMIENQASIFFDFNDPIVTNIAFHEIGENFLTVKTIDLAIPNAEVLVSPNPFVESTSFEIKGVDSNATLLKVYDINGSLIREETHSNMRFQFQKGNLTSGFYFYTLHTPKGQLIASGKMICN